MSSKDQKMMNELEALLSFSNDQEKIELEAELLHLKFIKVVENLMQTEGLNKADIAKKLNKSKSYITQLFSADKLVNMKTLAQLQRVLNVSFKIEAVKRKASFEFVGCGKFHKIYGLESIKANASSKKYRIEEKDDLKLVV